MSAICDSICTWNHYFVGCAGERIVSVPFHHEEVFIFFLQGEEKHQTEVLLVDHACWAPRSKFLGPSLLLE